MAEINNHQVRIIAGIFKGKNMPVADKVGLRPTPDRVRETIFTWLGNRCKQAKVLDLFAGSGALGVEALSRGAANVTLVELERENSLQLKNATTDMANINVVNDDAINFLNNTSSTYDLVFLDPPYASNLLEQCLPLLKKKNLINNNSVVYVEMNAGRTLSVPGFEVLKEGVAGQVKFALWQLICLPF